MSLIKKLLKRTKSKNKKREINEEKIAKFKAEKKMYQKKAEKFEEKYEKEKKLCGNYQFKFENLQEKIKKIEIKSSINSFQKLKTTKKNKKSNNFYETKIKSLEKQIIKLRSIYKNSKQFKIKDPGKIIPISNFYYDEDENDNYKYDFIIEASENFRKDLIEDIKSLRRFVTVIYSLVVSRRGRFNDERVVSKILGCDFFDDVVNEVYDLFYELI